MPRPDVADPTHFADSGNPAESAEPGLRSHLTLALCTVLHAFTHAYGSMLVPLYLLMVSDLRLRGVSYASAVVTAYGLVNCVLSYGAGVMADRWDRKALLGVGLLGNALAITAMGMTRQYEMILLCGILAGLFASLFHPAANALVPAHYPKAPGMAIGLLGIGSGVGFFAGPQFAGWRAETATWHWGAIGNWQRPLIEAGVAGFVIGILFLIVAREAHARDAGPRQPTPLGRVLGRRVKAVAAVLSLRDFAGLACLSLASIYLQKAHHLDAKRTGFIVGSMMLVSVIVSPLAVYISAGRRRLPMLSAVLVCGGAVVATLPFWPLYMVLPVLTVFMALQLGSYALSDAAMLERIPAAVRGRAVGQFLVIAGTFSAIAPWVMGWWTDRLHERAAEPLAYVPLFTTLAVMMIAAAGCAPLMHRLGDVEGPPIEPITETTPATVETVL